VAGADRFKERARGCGDASVTSGSLVGDVESIRHRTRDHSSDGAVTHNYQGQIEQTIDHRYM
jgi:hypothetical protein